MKEEIVEAHYHIIKWMVILNPVLIICSHDFTIIFMIVHLTQSPYNLNKYLRKTA